MQYPQDFEVVWAGGPLLPPRRSKPPRWWTMGGGHALTEQDPKETARLKESLRPKRAYNRKTATVQPPLGVTCSGEEQTDGGVSPVQRGAPASDSQSTAAGTGVGGLSPEPLLAAPHTAEGTVTE